MLVMEDFVAYDASGEEVQCKLHWLYGEVGPWLACCICWQKYPDISFLLGAHQWGQAKASFLERLLAILRKVVSNS